MQSKYFLLGLLLFSMQESMSKETSHVEEKDDLQTPALEVVVVSDTFIQAVIAVNDLHVEDARRAIAQMIATGEDVSFIRDNVEADLEIATQRHDYQAIRDLLLIAGAFSDSDCPGVGSEILEDR